MDAKIMELRVRKWLPIFEEQAKSGLSKREWCEKNGIKRWEFFQRLRECRNYLLEKSGTDAERVPAVPAIPSFVEVPVNTCQETMPVDDGICSKDSGRINISCGKFRISIEGNIRQDTLATVIREVSHA